MWIFLNNAALSIVAHFDRPGHLLVRSRIAGDIERVFPGAGVEHTPTFDYPYRTIIHRYVVGDAIQRVVERIEYTNFKNSVNESERHCKYLDVYNAMLPYRQVNPDYNDANVDWDEEFKIIGSPTPQAALFDDCWDDEDKDADEKGRISDAKITY